jgi:phosphoserine phosphatase RsbU/P
MESDAAALAGAEPASLVVIDPNGHRTRVPLTPVPFLIGRQPENHLVIRDSRASRSHARILVESGGYVIEDAGSRHGTFVNGQRIRKQPLHTSDKIEFGVPDSYQLIFALDGAELRRLLEQVAASEKAAPAPGVGGNLAKLRAILDLARTLQSSFSIDEVLTSVVDTALAITGAERGFLLLRADHKLEIRVARHRAGHHLQETDLRVPRDVIRRALERRRELLSMNFDPIGAGDTRPQNSVADLELRSVICVPLVHIRTGQGEVTSVVSTASETVGVLYMDSRRGPADMAGGNRELLQTLAIEASTVLENARLLEEERAKQQMDEELHLARSIQQSLLPKALPSTGWLHACGSSVASRQVGGDYFDVVEIHPNCWSVVVADVSGKGVSSALLASLLQGALITATDQPEDLQHRVARLNRFLLDRTGGEKYATVFYCLLTAQGRLDYVNAAHCPALLVRPDGRQSSLDATGMPVGLVEGAQFGLAQETLTPGDKLLIYTDGVTEAQNHQGEFFGKKRLREVAAAHAAESSTAIHAAIEEAVTAFTEGAAQSDDITLLVLEFAGASAYSPMSTTSK